jgi:hypothetical protein
MGCSASITSINKNSSSFLKDMKSALTFTTQRDSITAEVLSVSIGWHLGHILLTIDQIYSVLEKLNPEDFRESLNAGRSMLFAYGQMPRGKVKASKSISPPEIITLEKINLDYELALINIHQIDSLPDKAHFNHPYLGTLKREK